VTIVHLNAFRILISCKETEKEEPNKAFNAAHLACPNNSYKRTEFLSFLFLKG